jgi:hypothetical protein
VLLDQNAKSGLEALVTVKEPSPLEKATGMVVKYPALVKARSSLPSWLKSPDQSFAPYGVYAQAAKFGLEAAVTRNVPSPLENATGIVVHPPARS